MRIRLVLADDQATVREALAVMLDLDDDVDVVGAAPDGAAALELIGEQAPDVALLDLNMPVLDGVRATERIRAEHPTVKVLILTTFDDDASILGALQAGAAGYLTKDAGRDAILAAVRGAAQGQTVLDPTVQQRLLALATRSAPPREPPTPFTAREREILALIGEGLRNREIAERLVVSEATVKTHINNLFAKGGFETRADAVRYALRGGA
ncbi:response regulator transcription factor [Tsukamurella sp. 8F]|uniref:response regulator n=1 Tax=unclassified Tsukamurella TaxID=2633480 RepID=UPI0023B9BF8A|nr:MULTISPECIES: response regulator transcription factor [unclassified Tsukamurella]MDF0528890.1 response regulator transcription factor [Tsukamurella sp. 8J]MDF0586725.1 response regulator transcription factor [Tsukamurella sp. 8F]